MRSATPRFARPLSALAVLVLGSVVVADQRYVLGEGRITRAVNDWPRLVGAPLELVQPLGTLGAGLILTAVVAVVTLRPRATLALLASAFAAWRLDDLLKDLIERPRPAGVLHDITVRDEAATGLGYPSGHTTLAFAMAAVLHPLLPSPWRWLPWLLAAAVGVGRLYVGAHFPVDVVGGAALGIVIGGVAGLLVAEGYRRRAA